MFRLDPAERATLSALADLLIPAEDGMPAASAAGVPEGGVDYVLDVRPDLCGPLVTLLAEAADEDPCAFLRDLDPEAMAALGEVVAGAYYLDDRVRVLIGYHGRRAVPVDESEEIDPDLLAPVLARGPIFRDAK
ncbi:hypothetical protein ACIBG8_32530 [Nonomuraea sp. NPDC050556]|uniref:hypothetical protein n=1 Tax=Nonomuraea sp. NPDC050556 TaxID=3364369 RepID=UPI0037BDA28F